MCGLGVRKIPECEFWQTSVVWEFEIIVNASFPEWYLCFTHAKEVTILMSKQTIPFYCACIVHWLLEVCTKVGGDWAWPSVYGDSSVSSYFQPPCTS